ncbi:hypothetical protein F444_17770 [Phytophthora nicotianae P1976]|uniref:Uncharacterized protein n=1 Tax=Phytophthora nicotianae P1976 TaxID=1317066 RepID=A0A080ZDT4_PHYNI|nr:hypothetical protein F444_17770 [Phytophthora nicotianae P1976]
MVLCGLDSRSIPVCTPVRLHLHVRVTSIDQIQAYALTGVRVAVTIGVLMNSIFTLFMGFNPSVNRNKSSYMWFVTSTQRGTKARRHERMLARSSGDRSVSVNRHITVKSYTSFNGDPPSSACSTWKHIKNLKDQQMTNKISNCINILEAKDVLCGGRDDAQIRKEETLLQVFTQLYGMINSPTVAASLSAGGSTGLERFNSGQSLGVINVTDEGVAFIVLV